jgi:hypothetical protein
MISSPKVQHRMILVSVILMMGPPMAAMVVCRWKMLMLIILLGTSGRLYRRDLLLNQQLLNVILTMTQRMIFTTIV